jgi:L-alanine-DL-glutamate epimerase-like enolase superfamily enzyme
VIVTGIACHVLLAGAVDEDATSSAQDGFIVEVATDEGLVGIGETDLNPWLAETCIRAPGTHSMGRGLEALLLHENPLDVAALWERLYVGSAMNGRRGALVSALGAIELALQDIRGQALGQPVRRLLSPEAADTVVPYASLQPEPEEPSLEGYREELLAWARRAKEHGFRALKLETTFDGPYAHLGISASDAETVELIASVRDAVGRDTALMVDVQYAFMHDVERAIRFANECAPLEPTFLEAPLWPDDLASHARLVRDSPVPIASGEWLTTRHEFAELLEHGGVAVAQPDVGRVGGLGEAWAVAALAAEHGRAVVPHAWKTALSIAAAATLVAATPNGLFVEYLPEELTASELRRDLVHVDWRFRNGLLELPDTPGLGATLDREALARFAENAARAWSPRQSGRKYTSSSLPDGSAKNTA